MELKPVESSNVEAVGHEGDTLEVRFKGGARYRYQGVPREAYDELMAADSIGRHLNANIKPNFQYERVDKDDAE